MLGADDGAGVEDEPGALDGDPAPPNPPSPAPKGDELDWASDSAAKATIDSDPFRPCTRPSPMLVPKPMNSLDGDPIPRKCLAPLTAPLTTSRAAPATAPAMFLIPLISPRMRSS